MRKLVLQMGRSIDGYVSGGRRGGHRRRRSPAPRGRRADHGRIIHAGAHAMGRVTYGEMSGFWPTSNDPYAKPMNEIPKIVFSKTLDPRRLGDHDHRPWRTRGTRSPRSRASPATT